MYSKLKIFILLTIFLLAFLLSAKAEAPSGCTDDEERIEIAIKRSFPSVVKVEAQNRRKKVATGVVIDKKGHIVTTALISPREEKITITTSDGKKAEAEFLGLDSETHIAVLRVKDKKLLPISTGKAKELTPGTWIGVVSVSPENTPAVTQGIVSSVSKNELRLNVWVLPGWSGSPVINKEGYMIGLLRGVYFDDQPVIFEFREKELVGSGYVYSRAEAPSSGLARATPIDVVNEIASEIIKKGKVERGWLGVTIGEAEEGKVQIISIERESPAELAKLKEGDIVLRIGGKRIVDAEVLASEIRKRKPGQDVIIEIQRDGKTMKVKVKLGEYPEKEIKREFELKFPQLFPPKTPLSPKIPKVPEPPRIKLFPEKYSRIWETRKYIGVYLEELNRELSEHFGVEEGRGLIVSKVSKDSPAEKAGLKVGDVIVKADGGRVEAISDLSELIKDKKKGEKIKIEFLRNKRRMKLDIEVEEQERGGFWGYFFDNRDWEDYWGDYRDLWDDYNKKWSEYYKNWQKEQEKYSKELKGKMKKLKKEINEKSRDVIEKYKMTLLSYKAVRV